MKHTFHYLLMGSALFALAACGSSKGPGEIGSHEDIVIRNAGDPEPAPMAKAEEAVDPVIAQHQQAVEAAQTEIDDMAAKDKDDTPVPGDPIEAPVAAASDAAPDGANVLSSGSKAMDSAEESASAAETSMMEAEKVAVTTQPAVDVPEQTAMQEPIYAQTQMEAEAQAQTSEAAAAPMKRAVMASPDEPETILEPIDVSQETVSAEMVETPAAEPMAESATPSAVAAPTPEPEPEANPVVSAPAPAPAPLPTPVYEGDPAVSNPEMMAAQAAPATTTAQASAKSTVTSSGLIAQPSKGLIAALQKALNDKGYYFGAMDGNLGAETLNALHLYQSAHGLSDYGMTVETLEKLGVDATQY